MSETVRTSVEALEEMERGLAEFERRSQEVTASASRALADALAQVQSALAGRRSDLDRAQAALRACQSSRAEPPPDCRPLATAVARARDRLAAAEQAMREVERATSRHQSAQARMVREIGNLALAGRRTLTNRRRSVEEYLARTAMTGASGIASAGFRGSGGSGSSPMPVAPAVSGGPAPRTISGGPAGYAMVPLSLIVDSKGDGVSGPENFTKGYSIADLTWSYHALDTVILPTLERGGGLEDFMALDRAQELSGSRSYTDCYLGFLERNEAIDLEWRADGFHVGNGRHRIWLARQLGRADVPARISGM